MLYALVEGLAGVVDTSSLFRDVRLSPRWAAAGCAEVTCSVSYAASGAGLAYDYRHDEGKRLVSLGIWAKANVDLHLLLPPGALSLSLRVNGRLLRHTQGNIEGSRYIDARFPVRGKAAIAVSYEK
jgi:hypothetical protein